MSPAARSRSCAPAAAASRSDGGSCSRKSTVRCAPMAGTRSCRRTTTATRPTSICSRRSSRARSDDAAAPAFEQAALRQATLPAHDLADDRGRLPQLGDDDGGQLFPMCGRAPSDCRDTLAAASVILDEPTLAVGAVPEEVFWMCGALPLEDMPRTSTPWRSAPLTDSGYYVSRTASGDHLVFDAGRHGFLNGGHAHADALSVVLAIGGRPLLIDPGTATYTMDPARARSVPFHRDAQHGRAERTAAVGARRSVPLAIQSRRPAPRLEIRAGIRLCRRNPRRLPRRSRMPGAFSRCTASAGW